jgi:hypothetical protein
VDRWNKNYIEGRTNLKSPACITKIFELKKKTFLSGILLSLALQFLIFYPTFWLLVANKDF